MVLAGLGLNPAGVSLFRMHAPQSPLTRNWLPLEASVLAFFGPWSWWLHHLLFCGCIASSFCFFRPSERNVRQFYGAWFWQVWAWILLGFPCFGCVPHRALWRGIGFRLRLESSRFRALILVVASSFVCGYITSSFCFFRPSERNVRQFYGAWFWQVWAWILLGFPCFGCVPHKALLTTNWFPLEAWILAFSGLDLGGCSIFCLWLHCIIFLFL